MNNCCTTHKDLKEIADLASVLKIISEPNRLRILCLLKSGTKCVCEIQEALKLKQNLVSHHLGILRNAGLIDYDKNKQWKHYFLDKKNIMFYKGIFNKLLT